MYGIFTYIYHKAQTNIGKYTVHGWYGIVDGATKVPWVWSSEIGAKKIHEGSPCQQYGSQYQILLVFFPGGEDRLFFFRGLAFPYDPCMVYKYIYLHLVNFYDKCT